jgi:hypothetical protein
MDAVTIAQLDSILAKGLVRAVHALLAIIVQVGWQLEFAQLDSILQEAGDHVETALEAFIQWKVQVDALLV